MIHARAKATNARSRRQCKRLRARETLQPPTQDTGDHIDATWRDINAYWKTLRLPKSKRRLRWMTTGEAPEVEVQLPPLRLSNVEFIEAMSARQHAIDAQCLNIKRAMDEQRYEDTGAMYMFDMQQQHDPVQEGARELKCMITRSATLRAFWRRYTENNGIFVWQEVTEERGNHFLQHCRRWAVQLTYIQGRGAWCLPHVWRTWVEDVLGRVDMWVGGVPMIDWHVPIATVGDSSSPFTTPVTAILSNKEDEVTQLWTVQPDDNRQTWGDIQEAVERRGLPTRVLIGYPKQRQALICDVMRDCGNSWRMWVAYQGESLTCKTQDMYIDKRRRCHTNSVTIQWVVCEWRHEGLPPINIHKYVQGLSNICKRGRGAWRLPPGTHLGDKAERRQRHAETLEALQAERERLLSGGKDLRAMAANIGMQRSRAWCGTPLILGVVDMVGTRNFTCYMGAL